VTTSFIGGVATFRRAQSWARHYPNHIRGRNKSGKRAGQRGVGHLPSHTARIPTTSCRGTAGGLYFEQTIANVPGVPRSRFPIGTTTVQGPRQVSSRRVHQRRAMPRSLTLCREGTPGVNAGTRIRRGRSRSDQPQCFSRRYERNGRLWDFAATSTQFARSGHGENGQSGQHGRRPWAAGDPISRMHHCQIRPLLWRAGMPPADKNPSGVQFHAEVLPFSPTATAKRVNGHGGDRARVAN